jgi:hypothetical protein
MGVIRDTQREYFRQQERLIEDQPHMVHVIQEKRALRDAAHDLGIEYSVGDADPMCECSHHFSSHGKKGSKCITGDHCRCKKFSETAEKSQADPLLYVGDLGDFEKGKKGEDVFPHKYESKSMSPGGNWVYIYARDQGQRKTGFEKQPAPVGNKPQTPWTPRGKVPEVGNKYHRMQDELETAKQPPWVRNFFLASTQNPELTPKAMSLAVQHIGPQAFQAYVAQLSEKNKHIKGEDDRRFLIEMAARNVLTQKKLAEGQKTSEPKESAAKPGGIAPFSAQERQPFQMTPKHFEHMKRQHPAFKNAGDHRDHVEAAVNRGEYVPWGALKPYPDLAKEYEEKRPDLAMTPETKSYVEKFDKLTSDLKPTFDSWVKPDVKAAGDDILVGKKASGYNIDSYDVADNGVYSHMMTAKDQIVMYHMYAQHTDHGRELLAVMHEQGINPEYTVVKRASAVFWDPNWGDVDPEMSARDVDTPEGKKQIAYSSDYILAFRPRSQEESEAIYSVIQKKAHMGFNPQDALPQSWYVPDVRSSKKVDQFENVHLNVKSVGHQELCVLTKHDWIREGKIEYAKSPEEAAQGVEQRGDYDSSFRHENVWIEREQPSHRERLKKPTLAAVVKSDHESGEIIYVES